MEKVALYKPKKTFIKRYSKIIILLIIPIIAFAISLSIGRYSISFKEFIEILISKITQKQASYPEVVDTIIFQVRIPRIIAAMIIGAALSASGASYQGMFKNPMVSPDILGASAGAGFGAAFGILMSFSVIGIQISAFLFGLLAVLLTYIISVKVGKNSNAIFILILAGMLVGTLFQSFISLTKYVADPYDKLPAITFWLMGSLSSVSRRDILVLLIPFVVGIVPLFFVRWKLNVLSFGDEEARALGIDTKKLRIIVIICSTLMTASAVSVCGMIGWVGLVVPHFSRMIVGPDYRYLLPTSMLIGSTYLLMVDNIARGVASIEIPLGILTSIIGAPFFIYLLLNARKGWS
ncbi:ABC-type Fe3+-siderophore transport system, permease component [Gottschalkia purinilytica]|uniref:ABC-type Fe3+-siderophore transport system, permease component n=1 Tax=Gottschalkia purinilytica TaxID=1503 RepID=A0A0L0WB11_GOTPU|nr:iron ABC transporter permease [Gottschalkia purinilytica]KNF08683.1 ABC-type Fe3+-siderophore transport system, permease component [Gottschalkia purinilytica]